MGKSRNRLLLEAAMQFRREYKVINVLAGFNTDGAAVIKSFVKKRVN